MFVLFKCDNKWIVCLKDLKKLTFTIQLEIGSFLVKNGRHPLQEQCVDTFVSNDIGMLDSDEEIQPGKVIMIFKW